MNSAAGLQITDLMFSMTKNKNITISLKSHVHVLYVLSLFMRLRKDRETNEEFVAITHTQTSFFYLPSLFILVSQIERESASNAGLILFLFS